MTQRKHISTDCEICATYQPPEETEAEHAERLRVTQQRCVLVPTKLETILVCSEHRKQLVWSWEKHDWVCPICGGTNSVVVAKE